MRLVDTMIGPCSRAMGARVSFLQVKKQSTLCVHDSLDPGERAIRRHQIL